MMKKIILFSTILLFFVVAPHVLAADGFTALAPIPGLTDAATLNTASGLSENTLAQFFNNLYKYLIGLAAVFAIIEIIWGGLEISTKDSVSKQSDGKARIQQAIFGLVLVLSPVLVFSVINPNILNLSLNLPKLDTAPVTTGPGSGPGSGPGVVDPASGCNAGNTSSILQVATCPSDAAATAWGQNCTNGNLSTTKVTNTNPANGVVTNTNVVTCAGKPTYLFIDRGGAWVALTTFIVNRVQPLVRSTDRPTNGSDAMSFASICQSANVGFQTCISDDPDASLPSAVPCQLTTTDPSYGTTWKCYNEKLTCEKVLTSGKCSTSPSWTPFQ